MGNAYRDLLLSKSSLVSYWPLDTQVDGSGNALDLKSGYNGTKQGGVTLGGFTPGPLLSNPSQPTTDFDGTNDYLNAGSHAALDFPGTTAFTVMAWVRLDVQQDNRIISNWSAGGAGYELICATGANRLGFRRLGQANPFLSFTPSVDTWYFVVATYDGTNLRLYVNGSLSAGPTADGSIAASGVPLNIGRRTSDADLYFNGKLAHVAILNAALSVAEIAELWAAANYLESSLLVRELPPDRQDIDILTPSGRHYHWAEDEPNPANVFSDLRNSSVMPGGFESMDCRLPRKSGTDYADLERLSTATIRDASGGIDGEYRLERAPRVSGDEFVISPSAVGWQAHLEDNKAAAMIYVDQDLSHWIGPSVQWKVNANASAVDVDDGSVVPDATTGVPSIKTALEQWGRTHQNESWYASQGTPIGSVYFAWKKNTSVNNADASWFWAARIFPNDLATGGVGDSGNLRGAGPGTGTVSASDATGRFVQIFLQYTGAGGATGNEYAVFWRPAVYGNHALTKRGTADATHAQGFFDGDVIADFLSRFCPLLRYTTGQDGTITPSGFVIDHLEFRDPTTPAEMLKQTLRFVVRDWAVWENKTFWLHDRGVRGRKWRARVGPSQLNENGPQMDRLWESIVVQYNDVDGSTRTVGPPGSNADSTDSRLKDSDTENPANKLGLTRRDLLVMGTSTPAGAAEVGARFMVEQKKLDTSGQAQFVGYVQDDRGVIHPGSRVRAGDQVSFIDAADTSYRRIVKADHNRPARTCSVDLDSPPDGLQALLEELSVVLVPLGFT